MRKGGRKFYRKNKDKSCSFNLHNYAWKKVYAIND